jgi:hypothetical protein
MGAKLEKGLFNQENEDDIGRLYGLEQSISQLSRKIDDKVNDLPDHNIIKPKILSYTMQRSKRFSEEYKEARQPGPMSYFINDKSELQNKPGSKMQKYAGGAQRFTGPQYQKPSGPGYYKIAGFSDEVLKKSSKKFQKKKQENASKGISHGMSEIVEYLDDDHQEHREDNLEESDNNASLHNVEYGTRENRKSTSVIGSLTISKDGLFKDSSSGILIKQKSLRENQNNYQVEEFSKKKSSPNYVKPFDSIH